MSSYGAGVVEFSHKRHAPLKLLCAYCHAGALAKERAEFPAAAICLGCHQSIEPKSAALEAVRGLPKDAKPFPVHRVYTIPDFVYFSHGKHAEAGVKCDACHGNVAGSHVVTKEVKMTMMWCVNCHRTSHAPVTCTVCHELSQ
jgi:Cytochrome c7 and related cytochrome c